MPQGAALLHLRPSPDSHREYRRRLIPLFAPLACSAVLAVRLNWSPQVAWPVILVAVLAVATAVAVAADTVAHASLTLTADAIVEIGRFRRRRVIPRAELAQCVAIERWSSRSTSFPQHTLLVLRWEGTRALTLGPFGYPPQAQQALAAALALPIDTMSGQVTTVALRERYPRAVKSPPPRRLMLFVVLAALACLFSVAVGVAATVVN